MHWATKEKDVRLISSITIMVGLQQNQERAVSVISLSNLFQKERQTI